MSDVLEPAESRTPWNASVFRSRWAAGAAATVTVLLILLVPGVGVLFGFAFALVLVLLARRHGGGREVGLTRPDSWGRLIGLTLLYGLALQLFALVLLEPALTALLGAPVDVGDFDAVRGSVVNTAILLVIGWVIGGLLEEFTFRGFLLRRVEHAVGAGWIGTTAGLLAAAVPFGLAHLYQGWTGVISTGTLGLAFGLVFVLHRRNLWAAVLTHGFANTFGILAIGLSWDRPLLELLGLGVGPG